MGRNLPLPTLLSHALVAFIVEFDNEFEHQVPHRTTNHGYTPGSPRAPWLVSMAMWIKILRHIPDGGIPVGELKRSIDFSDKAFLQWLTRLSRWWGYLTIEMPLRLPTGPAHRNKLPSDAIVRPTRGGLLALHAWRPLIATIEQRWQQRFGDATVAGLNASLAAVNAQFDPALPEFLPILGYGFFCRHADDAGSAPTLHPSTLPTLLSRTLLAFALEFEQDSPVSLAMTANLLRLFQGEEALRPRDLPALAGISKEAVAGAVDFLAKHGYAVLQPESGSGNIKTPGKKAPGKGSVVRLTAQGHAVQQAALARVADLEAHWLKRWPAIAALRTSLEKLAGDPGPASPLLAGLKPYPDGWRASLPPVQTLPHFPMILHRGGFPDGS